MRRLLAAAALAAGALAPAGPALACVIPDCVLGVVDDLVEPPHCWALVRNPMDGSWHCVP